MPSLAPKERQQGHADGGRSCGGIATEQNCSARESPVAYFVDLDCQIFGDIPATIQDMTHH